MHAGSEALTAPRSTADPGHLGGGTGLVDEDQPLRIKVALAVETKQAWRRLRVGTFLIIGYGGRQQPALAPCQPGRREAAFRA